MEKDALISLLKKRKENATPTEELATKRTDSVERYLGRPYGDERKGQSSVVTRQCMEAVEWTLPSIMRVFASTSQVAEFTPVGPEDEAAAKQETEYVNHTFMVDNNGFCVLYTLIKDALMTPGSYAKVYWEEISREKKETYQGLSPEEIILLQEEGEIVGATQNDDGSYDITLRTGKYKGQVRVIPVPQEELRIDDDLSSVDLTDAPYICHTVSRTRSQLVEAGYSKTLVDELPLKGADSTEKTSRHEPYKASGDDKAADKTTELLDIDEHYLWIDTDGDGVSEYRMITVCGDEVLENVEVDSHPFIPFCAVPMPHKHIGLSWQELVEDLQRIYTTLTRQLLNNMYRSNNPRTVIGRGVSLTDVVNDTVGAPIRATDINQIRMEPTRPIISDVLPAFEMLDRIKEGRTGVSRTTMGLDADALSRVTKGAFLGALEQSNQRLELLTRIFAEFSLKPLFLRIHKLLLTHQKDRIPFKTNGTWIEVSPSEWKERTNMSILVGLGTGNKQAQAAALDKIIQLQAAIVGNGGMGVLVQPQNIFNSASRLVEAVGLPTPEAYFTDPSKQPQQPQSAPPPDPLAEVQLELVKVEREKALLKAQTDNAALQHKMHEAERKYQTEIGRLQALLSKQAADATLAERRLDLDAGKAILSAEVELTKIGASASVDAAEERLDFNDRT